MRFVIPLPSHEYIRECFKYNKLTGELCWKKRPAHHFRTLSGMKSFNGAWVGKRAGCPDESMGGYLRVGIQGRLYLVHRLVFKLVSGKEPSPILDHKNLCVSDNRFRNLREATDSMNKANSRLSRVNTSGLKGVSFHKATGKYGAYIKLNQKLKWLGLFPTKEEAHQAYCMAAKDMFKEFANDGRTR